MTSIGTLSGSIIVKDQFSKTFSKFGGDTKQLKIAAGGLAIGVVAVGAAMAAAVSKATAFADALDNQSIVTGVATESLQVFNIAAQQAGGTSGDITNAIIRLQRGVADSTQVVVEAFRQLGLEVSSLKNLSPEQQFVLIQKELAKIEDPARRVATAFDIFGKSGAKLRGLAGDTLPKLEKRLRDLGIVMDADVVTAVDAVELQFDLLKRTSGALFTNFGAGLTSVSGFSKSIDLLTNAFGFANKAILTAFDLFNVLPGPIQAVVIGTGVLVGVIAAATLAWGAFSLALGAIGFVSVTALIVTMKAAVLGLVATLTPLLIPALAVLAAVVAGLAIGTAIFKFLEWAGVIADVETKVAKLVSTMEPSTEQITALTQASEIAGRKITDWKEATEILNTQLEGMRVVTDVVPESTAQYVARLLKAQEVTGIFEKATSLAGIRIEDMAVAQEVLRQAADLARIATEEQTAALEALKAKAELIPTAFLNISTQMPLIQEIIGAEIATIVDEHFEEFGAGLDGVNSQVGGLQSAVSAAFQSMGIKTKKELLAIAEAAQRNFNTITASGQASADALAVAAERLSEAQIAAGLKNKEAQIDITNQITGAAINALSIFAGKSKVAAIAIAIIKGFEAIQFALAGPFPFNLINAAIVGVMTARNVASIRSQGTGLREGTPGADFVDFGTATETVLHGPEAVINPSNAGDLAKQIGTVLAPMLQASGNGGGGGTTILEIDGVKFGRLMEKMMRDGLIRVPVSAIRET